MVSRVVAEVIVEQDVLYVAWADSYYQNRIRLSRSGGLSGGACGAPDLHGPGGGKACRGAQGHIARRWRLTPSGPRSRGLPSSRLLDLRLGRRPPAEQTSGASSASMYRTPRMRRCAAS